MSNVISGRATAGFVLAAATAVTAVLGAQQQRAPMPLECELTLEAEVLPIRVEPFQVSARITEAVGDELAVTFAEESRVGVVEVERDAETDPLLVQLTVNTQEAVAGDWSVVLRGEAGECAGTVTVAPADPGRL